MSSSVLLSNGTVMKSGGTALADLLSIDGPGMKRKVIDTTSLGDASKNNNVGLPEYGEITFTANSTTATYNTVKTLFDSGATATFAVVDTGSITESQTVRITALKRKYQIDEKVTFDATAQITGAIS